MNLAPRVYGIASTPAPGAGVRAASALGIAVAATAGGLAQLAVGYGVLFGAGGGAAYILAQQAVNLAVTRRHGLVNGYLVALYPAGAMIAAPIFGWSIRAFGVRATLGGLAAVLAITGSISAWLIARSRRHARRGAPAAAPAAGERRRAVFWRLWLVFFLAASAGLMVLSQAAGIITAYGGATALAVYGTTFIAGSIAVARVGGGWMVDWLTIPDGGGGGPRGRPRRQRGADAVAGPGVSVPALTLVGLGYGVISGLTAAAVGRLLEPRALRPGGGPDLPGVVRRGHHPADRRRAPVRPDPGLRRGGPHRRRRQRAGHAGRARPALPARDPETTAPVAGYATSTRTHDSSRRDVPWSRSNSTIRPARSK